MLIVALTFGVQCSVLPVSSRTASDSIQNHTLCGWPRLVMPARVHTSGASTHDWALCCDPHASGFCGLQSCGHRLANRSIGPQQEAEYRDSVRELRTASYAHEYTLGSDYFM